MVNILIESEEFLLSTTEGMYNLIYNVVGKNADNIRLRRFSKLRADDLKWCDVIISVRGKSQLSLQLAKFSKRHHKYHILYMDDDFLDIPDTYGRYGAGIYPKRKKILREILDYTDCIWSANKLLGEKYSNLSLCKKYINADTAVEEKDIYTPKEHQSSKIKMVLYVNDGSTGDFDKYIAPILKPLAIKYPNRLHLTLMTLKPALESFDNLIEIELVDHMTYPEFKKFMRSNEFNIGLAPLSEGEFAKYKYINKFFEYSFAGIVGAYSNCPLYADVISDGENGILCENTEEGWFSGLSRLIESEALREKCVEKAQYELLNKYSMSGVVEKLKKDCPELVSFSASHHRACVEFFRIRVKQRIFVLSECLYFSAWSIKNGGILLLLQRIGRYFKRVVTNERLAKKND